MLKIDYRYWFVITVVGISVTSLALAAPSGMLTLGSIAAKITGTMADIGKLLVAAAYLAGFGFLVFGVLKFKQHKDNPTQVTLGMPVVMILIGAALMFVGGFVAPLGDTFGFQKEQVGGFSGSGAKLMPGGSSSTGSP